MKKRMNAAERIASLADRAHWQGEAVSKIAGHKIECFLGAQTKPGHKQRVHFRIDRKRISRSALFVFLEEALSA